MQHKAQKMVFIMLMQEEKINQKEVPHFDSHMQPLVNMVESQLFNGKLAQKFMTSTTVTK